MAIVNLFVGMFKLMLFASHGILTRMTDTCRHENAYSGASGVMRRPGRRATAAICHFRENGGYAS